MEIYQLNSPVFLQAHLEKNFEIYSFVDDWDNHEAMSPSAPPTSSPKGLLFSEKENLFKFDGKLFRETIPSPNAFALFGVRSCDLTAIAYQDQFFADDPYYQARRNKALLVGIDCVLPCKQGFCHSVNAGPGVDPECADLILHRLDQDHWLLLVIQDKGKEAIAGLNLTPAKVTALRQRENRINYCEKQFPNDNYLQDGITAINEGKIPDQVWDEMGLQCLGCSGCTSLCPTCSCYGTREVLNKDKQPEQQRFWDSCLYEGFQREASQHNPSVKPGARVKRFWTHKFGKTYADSFGRYGCVGCGRCEQTCPGVIGIHSVMRRVAQYAQPNTD